MIRQIAKVKKLMIIYIDEVGRWPLAGPVYVWLILIKGKVSFKGYKDSKKCTQKLREALYQRIIKEKNVHRTTAKCEHGFIDKYWISKAIHTAITKGLEDLLSKQIKEEIIGLKHIIKHIGSENIILVLDGNHDFKLRKTLGIEVATIIHGDDLIPQISMASIIAKVERDTEMIAYHKKYPKYGFNQHKWYGTLLHRTAIQQYGPCRIHRKSYLTKLKKI